MKSSDGSSTSSHTSVDHINAVIERLKASQNRTSTNQNYHAIWKKFNKFVIRLDKIPQTWEDRTYLYAAHLVEAGIQSLTLRSYISAIKMVLECDGYNWDNRKMLLNTITKACKLKNDVVKTRLPISSSLLEMILFEVDWYFTSGDEITPQPFLCYLDQALFAVAYYGLLRIGELATGTHPVKAKDMHIGRNKDKILLVLRSSKTHGKESRPQKVKIVPTCDSDYREQRYHRHFCPFKLMRKYFHYRGNYPDLDKPFFVFRDGSLVIPDQVHTVLRKMLDKLNLDVQLYDTHLMCIEHASDMYNKFNYSLEEVKKAGRWKSNAVYRYLKS